MNIEDYREFCLSLGEDIEEKLPFQKFKNGEGVLRRHRRETAFPEV